MNIIINFCRRRRYLRYNHYKHKSWKKSVSGAIKDFKVILRKKRVHSFLNNGIEYRQVKYE